MRFTPRSLAKAFAPFALLASLGSHAATATVEINLTPPVSPAPQVNTAPKQDFATLLARENLRKQGIIDPTQMELDASV